MAYLANLSARAQRDLAQIYRRINADDSDAALKARADALVRLDSGDLIPVERKKTLAPRRGPYDANLIQEAVYCILVEEESGRTPPFMRIQYADRWFDEPYTPELKTWVLENSARLRQARRQNDCPRSHRIAAKCRNCGQRGNCAEAL